MRDLLIIFTFKAIDLLKIYYKPGTGGRLAKVAYLIATKSLDLARFLLISKRALVGGIKPVGSGN